jgi:hypothetical protein
MITKNIYTFINDATAITIFFRRQAEKSLGLLQIKLQKLTFWKNHYNRKEISSKSTRG